MDYGDSMLEKLKKIVLFLFLFFVFLYKDLIYLIPMKLLSIDYDALSYNIQTLYSILASLVLVLFIMLIYRKYLKIKAKDYKEHFGVHFDIGIKYWFIGLVCMSVSNLLISKFSPVHEANNEALVQEMLKQAPLLSFISASLLAPFLEEMLFRKCLGDIFKNKTVMIVMSALVFGALHVVFTIETPWDLLYIIPYGALGGAFATALAKTDNIYVPITFHMLHNGILTLFSILLSVIS